MSPNDIMHRMTIEGLEFHVVDFGNQGHTNDNCTTIDDPIELVYMISHVFVCWRPARGIN